jgi:hypothetical protein
MKTFFTTVLMILISTNFTAFAADNAKTPTKMKMGAVTPTQRQSMATLHENMAVCLRTEKAIEDCRKEMMQSCKEQMGKNGCPMMEKMHGMKHGMKHGMMMDKEEEQEDKEEEKGETPKK